ncbi:hypothetical protein A3D68_00695 [Candidatus Adlerbacteria bacterium RIFCSPHIGHO2_02_FULL_52_17]|uniref:isoleucine--tRNA ligase n=1 Tax=Candidatus Adlerbacteria bacterium RIFCSPHIGHO2_02_FULL_52_17 TaxID=1797240 RepID=A0A1F4XPZ7_9BACT|nr:MAG: hypothetical protein A3D68_00695 [Candidatus Adlerbacteria bacterium RIFCSPHIGHO2_02_FULL_52_17]
MSEQGKSETSKREEEVLRFWQNNRIFEKSLEKKAHRGDFVFYDGPPFATGLPHHGSLLSSIIKDVVPRYKTMRGWRVPRRWGWDCHGLPIENLVEKKLGLKNKKDILGIGIDAFNDAARDSVFEFEREWEKYVDRVGRWVDFKNSYKTMDNSYVESVWWALQRIHRKKLLYEGRKVLMYCPHCETPLAKAEIAADNTYKDITEEAVTVKLKVKNTKKYNLPDNTYLLAWTTTPWTLPGNVGLTVGANINYVLVEQNGEYLVVAKDRATTLRLLSQKSSGSPKTFAQEAVASLLGRQLVGAEYEPLFDVPALHSNKSYKVYAADFVNTNEGTGIVHTAVMYGEDDYALGRKEGLPMVQLLNPNGTYNDAAPALVRGEYIKKAEKVIKEDLERRRLLFKREHHTHSYPHCWRCGTPLIYNAVASWFINIQKIKRRMLKENKKINWVPEHLKHGRFKNILEGAPDWTISRNRFWASPMPIWKEKGGSGLMVIGSVEELLSKAKKSGNHYMVMRHGGARSNAEGFVNSSNDVENHLTAEGRAGVRSAAHALLREKVDLIVASPLTRAQETAHIVRKELGLPESSVMTDERLTEVQFGEKNGAPIPEWEALFATLSDKFNTTVLHGENYLHVRRRVGEFLFEIERRYTNKRILIVTHGTPAWLLVELAAHTPLVEVKQRTHDTPLGVGQWAAFSFVPYPHNKDFEIDLHRPYIDETVLVDRNGRQYERVPEVVDCWVESGTMPTSSAGYPNDRSTVDPERWFGLFPKGYPADFIAEYIGQTRTWFYYMLAASVALFGKRSFNAVVSTGNLLAADGAKLSKSKGNYTDPLVLLGQFGADAYRFYLMGSVVMRSEDLQFRDEDVREVHNRIVGMLWNSYKFFELYKEQYDGTAKAVESAHVLDRWIRSRLGETVQRVTVAFDEYNIPDACRALRACIDDYSTWYVRRSRERTRQAQDDRDAQYTLAVQKESLDTLSRLAAPIMPFIAESIYRGVDGECESVHLADWPEALTIDREVLAGMSLVRSFATVALKQREDAGIKIRQPLAKFSIVHNASPLSQEFLDILADEINVKEIVFEQGSAAMESSFVLDTNINQALKEEGMLRDLVRRIQAWRKEEKLSIANRPAYTLLVSKEEEPVAQVHKATLKIETGLGELTIVVREST